MSSQPVHAALRTTISCVALATVLCTVAGCTTTNADTDGSSVQIDTSTVEAGRVLINGQIDASHDLVVRIDRGDKPTEWRTGGRDGEFEVLVEASDTIRLDGAQTGPGFVVTVTQGAASNVFYVHCAGDLAGKFTIRREADFMTRDGVLTFADILLKDRKPLPVSLHLAPARSRK